MKNRFFIFNIIIICSFALFVVINFFTNNGEFSQMENRALQKAPEFSFEKIVLLSGADNPGEIEGSTTYSLPYWMGRYYGLLGD